MSFWPFNQWSPTKKEWDDLRSDVRTLKKQNEEILMALKSVDDVLDQVNTALDTQAQVLSDLATEEQAILVEVTDLVNKVTNGETVSPEKLAGLQSRVQAQSDALAQHKTALDAIVQAGQQPTT